MEKAKEREFSIYFEAAKPLFAIAFMCLVIFLCIKFDIGGAKIEVRENTTFEKWSLRAFFLVPFLAIVWLFLQKRIDIIQSNKRFRDATECFFKLKPNNFKIAKITDNLGNDSYMMVGQDKEGNYHELELFSAFIKEVLDNKEEYDLKFLFEEAEKEFDLAWTIEEAERELGYFKVKIGLEQYKKNIAVIL